MGAIWECFCTPLFLQKKTFAVIINKQKILQMSTIQFIGTSPADLITELENSLIPKLAEKLSAQFQPKEPTEYLTRSEVCQLLKIDLSSLHRWRKEGKIPSFGISNRVYFKRSDIDAIINENKLS